jgi:hypothetical protein
MKVHHLGNLNTVISALKDAGVCLILYFLIKKIIFWHLNYLKFHF